MKKFILLLVILFTTASCDSSAISLVKNGSLDDCSDHTVEELVDGYFKNPEWEEIVADDDRTYVNITGEILYEERPVKAKLQFKISNKNDRFQAQAFEIDGIGQNDFMILSLLASMCEEAF
tara:strand:+ start:143 stop:505 length:363 start_codon:yes stop_codon:yes gene_type:complete